MTGAAIRREQGLNVDFASDTLGRPAIAAA
jgi:hypothetical protein